MTDEIEKAQEALQAAADASYRDTLAQLENRIVAIETRPEVSFDDSPIQARLNELNDTFGGRINGLDERIKAFETKHETKIDPDDEEVISDSHEVETPVASAGIDTRVQQTEQAPKRKHLLFSRPFGSR